MYTLKLSVDCSSRQQVFDQISLEKGSKNFLGNWKKLLEGHFSGLRGGE